MDLLKFILIPLISSFIGYLTNVIAIKFLFHPRKKILFLQGVIPKRKAFLAKKISIIIKEKIFTEKEIKLIFKDPQVKKNIIKNFEKMISFELEKVVPHMFLSMSKKIFSKILEKNKNKIFSFFENSSEKNISNLKIEKYIEKRINSFDVMELEGIIKNAAKTELQVVEISGAILGLLIGFIQVLLFTFL